MKQLASMSPAEINALMDDAVSMQSSGKLAEAIDLLTRLSEAFPNDAELLYLVGTATSRQGDHVSAIRLLEKARQLEPNVAEIPNNLGMALLGLGRTDDALRSFDQSVQLNPSYAIAHFNRGNALRMLGRPADALQSYSEALRLQPAYVEAHINKAVALASINRVAEALSCLDSAAKVQPNSPEIHFYRGNALLGDRHLGEALESFDAAIKLAPDSAEAHMNRGTTLHLLGNYDEAVRGFERSIAIDPLNATAYCNKAISLQTLKRFSEARECYDLAILAKHDYAEALYRKGELLLLLGEYEEGWTLFERRWQSDIRPSASPYSELPVWTGEQAIGGRRILVHGEVGFGDFIMFARYIRMIHDRQGRPIVCAPRPLLSLFRSFEDIADVVEEGLSPPDADFRCPIMSLPRAFNTRRDTIPQSVPYIGTDRTKALWWQQGLSDPGVLRVGLMWSGKLGRDIDITPAKSRTIPLALLEPLTRLPVQLHALQKELSASESDALASLPAIHDHRDQIGDFSDTAALIGAMDLVLSIDTSVAHLAGALGRPLWVMLPYSTDYRWGADGDTTPWYPTARIFRQARIGDWPGVVNDVVDALRKLAESREACRA
jgi:tetratricopeptide (TPR) repeat protein